MPNGFTKDQYIAVAQILDLATQRGIFTGQHLTAIGGLYDAAIAFAQAIEQAEKDAPASE